MPLFWPRNRVNQVNSKHIPCRRRWLALERLEDRCLLSAQLLPSGSAGLPLSNPPTGDMSSISSQAVETVAPFAVTDSANDLGSPIRSHAQSSDFRVSSTGTAVLAPLPLLTSPTQSVVVAPTSLSGLTLTVSSGGGNLTETNHLPSVPQETGLGPPDASTGTTPVSLQTNTSDNGASPDAPGQTLVGAPEKLVAQSLAPLAPSRASLQVQELLPNSGSLSSDESGMTLQHSTIDSSAPQRNEQGVLTGLVSWSTGGIHRSVGTLSTHRATLTAQGSLRREDTSALASIGRPLGHATLTVGKSTAEDDTQGLLFRTEENVPELIQSWLTEIWVEHTLSSPFVAATGYSATGAAHNSLNPPAVNFILARSAAGNAELGGTDAGAETQADLASAATAAHTEIAGGFAVRENELGDKPTTGTGTLANPLPVPSTLPDSIPAIAADFDRGSPALSFAPPALWDEPAPWLNLAASDSRLHLALRKGPPSTPATVVARPGIFPALPAVDAHNRFALFQTDVVSTATAPNDMALPGTSGPTSVYQAQQNSYFWSALTTYALVLMPRQRRPQPTILVVDPDDATREALNLVLVHEGYFVLPAASVRDAWGMFRTPHARIDLVLLDPHLPDVSGIHLCARLRELSPTLPVMVCAQDVEPAEVAQLQQLGVRYYLRKPIAPDELLHTVKAILA